MLMIMIEMYEYFMQKPLKVGESESKKTLTLTFKDLLCKLHLIISPFESFNQIYVREAWNKSLKYLMILVKDQEIVCSHSISAKSTFICSYA